jgi:hypothetical protein
MQHSGPNEFPSQLFNAMVAPLTSFAIKGALCKPALTRPYALG